MTRKITLHILTVLFALSGASAKTLIQENQTSPKDCLNEQTGRRVHAQQTHMPSGTYGCEFGIVDLLCGGCVGGKLINQPTLCYPRLAKAARISGWVKMKIVVDRRGKVVWARAQNNAHSLLLAAATQEALERRYEPFVCNGRPVKAVVYINYKFGVP